MRVMKAAINPFMPFSTGFSMTDWTSVADEKILNIAQQWDYVELCCHFNLCSLDFFFAL